MLRASPLCKYHKKNFSNKIIYKRFFLFSMEKTSFFYSVFLLSTIITISLYSIISGFGPESKNFIDPFNEHED